MLSLVEYLLMKFGLAKRRGEITQIHKIEGLKIQYGERLATICQLVGFRLVAVIFGQIFVVSTITRALPPIYFLICKIKLPLPRLHWNQRRVIPPATTVPLVYRQEDVFTHIVRFTNSTP